MVSVCLVELEEYFEIKETVSMETWEVESREMTRGKTSAFSPLLSLGDCTTEEFLLPPSSCCSIGILSNKRNWFCFSYWE